MSRLCLDRDGPRDDASTSAGPPAKPRAARPWIIGPVRAGLVLGLVFLPMCSGSEAEPRLAPSCREGGRLMARLELVLGASTPRGSVGPRAFARFLAEEVTPRFPDGLTFFEGNGQWRDRIGIVSHERSRLLLIWYEPDATSEAKIEAIRAAYKRRFRQESVLRADGASCVSL